MSIFGETVKNAMENSRKYHQAIAPAVQLIIMCALVYGAATRWLPLDMNSTSLWYDSLPIQDQTEHVPFAPYVNGPWANMPDTTDVAGWFAVLISGGQAVAAFRMVSLGDYGTVIDKHGRRKKLEGGLVGLVQWLWAIASGRKFLENNMRYIAFTVWLVLLLIDVFSDIAYRSYNFANIWSFLSAVFMSIFLFNLASEVLITGGPAEIIASYATLRQNWPKKESRKPQQSGQQNQSRRNRSKGRNQKKPSVPYQGQQRQQTPPQNRGFTTTVFGPDGEEIWRDQR